MSAPRQRDLPSNINELVANARDLWLNATKEEFEKDGKRDSGCCILGDGVVMDVILPRKRKASQMMLISAREVQQCQGSLHYERCKSVAVDYLRANGIDAYYNSGWMD